MTRNKPTQGIRWGLVVTVIIVALLMAPSGVVAQQATVTTDGPTTASPGETITVTVTLSNTKQSQENYIADVSLPDGWTVESHTDDGGTWNSGDISWLWQNIPANNTVTPAITVTVPSQTDGGSATISTAAKSKNGTEDTATHTIDIPSSSDGSEFSSKGTNDNSDTGTSQGSTQPEGEPSESEDSRGDSESASSGSNTRTVHEIKDANPDQPGTTVDTSETTTVDQVSFNSESVEGELEINAYENIPQEVSTEISESISEDLATTAESDSDGTSEESQSENQPEPESTDSQSAPSTSVVTVADISPPTEAKNVDASIRFTVSKDTLSDPEQAVITHKRDTGWHRLQTKVVSTTDESVTLEASTESFSLFAVVEDTATPKQSTENDSSLDKLSTFHLTGLLFGLLGVLILRRYQS